MKITVLTLGSRGDVQPYVALGKELVHRGHEVNICTGESFKNLIESNGITFHKATLDFMEIVKTEQGQAIINGGGNLFKTLKFAKAVIYPGFRETFNDFMEATKGTDLIIYHPKAMLATDLAQYLNIPCISVPPVPIIYPLTEFPNLAITRKNLGKTLNKLTYKGNKYGESASMKDINNFRTNVLNLPKRNTGDLYSAVSGVNIPIIYPISPSLFEEVHSWDEHVELTGFFFMDLAGAKLSQEITEFLANGEAPIIVSFSSMPLKNPERFKQLLLESLESTKDRAIVLTGVSGLDFSDHPNVLAVEKAPHRLLFKEGKGIIHHGGVGTMSEALLSGVPQVIMPFSVDQPFWAGRLYKLGYALEPLKEKTLTRDILKNTFKNFSDSDSILKAKEIRLKLQKENGILNAADFIERGNKHA